MRPIDITADQALYHRARCGFLTGKGAQSVAQAATRIIGAQSQLLAPSLHALSLRTQHRPTAAEVKDELVAEPRSLVRCWGQRDTLFVFSKDDWPTVCAADTLLSPGGRGGPMPTDAVLKKALAFIDKATDPLTRTDLIRFTPASYVKAVAERAALGNMDAKRFAAGRIFWRLAHLGHVCVGEKQRAEQSYPARSLWYPTLKWETLDPADAAVELTRRYLHVHGPATANDIAHFLGAKITLVRQWLQTMEAEILSVKCGDRSDLVALQCDAESLKQKPATGNSKWSSRLLPAFEAMLMAHADKSWIVPDEQERKLIWRKAAQVSAIVLTRGRVVATWTQKATTKKLSVTVQPLSQWRKTKHLTAVRAEAEQLAQHLELNDVEIHVQD